MRASHVIAAGVGLAGVLILTAVSAAASHHAGSLARDFGDSGTVVTQVGPADSGAFAVRASRAGKLLVLGRVADDPVPLSTRFLLARYLENGKLDSSFGAMGTVQTGFGRDYAVGFALALQPDGKIVAAGNSSTGDASDYGGFALARYLSSGALDKSFGAGGKVVTDFGTDPGDFAAAASIAVQGDGKIVAVGYDTHQDGFLLARYLANGQLDRTFGRGGSVLTTFPTCPCAALALALQPDGKLVVGGFREVPKQKKAGFLLARYRRNGALDTTFAHDGVSFTILGGHGGDYSEIHALALQPNGMIVAAGGSEQYRPDTDRSKFALARYRADGSLDRAFGQLGWEETPYFPGGSHFDTASSLALQSDGKILVAGRSGTYTTGSDFALARYLYNGALDRSFGNHGTVRTNVGGGGDAGFGVALQPLGRIVVAGTSDARTQQTFGVALAGYVRGSLQCVVPAVRGTKLGAAKELIRKGRCSVGTVRRRPSPTIGKGRVISERPRAGARRRRGSAVTLVVSAGRRRK